MTTGPDERALDAIADAEQFPYWYDDVDEPDSNPTLVRTEHCDLCVVGGGYTGLCIGVRNEGRSLTRHSVSRRHSDGPAPASQPPETAPSDEHHRHPGQQEDRPDSQG
jgi:hypothetical protein